MLTFDCPFDASGSVNNGSKTTFPASAQGSVTTGELAVTDGYVWSDVGVFVGLGTSGNDAIGTDS